MLSPAISEAEIRAVQDGIANDVRGDGRTLTQRRTFTIKTNYSAGASLMDVEHDGSCVEVQCGGTTIVAAATPSVIELPECSEAAAAGGKARGPLFVSIDAVPAVVDYYAQSLRNRGGRYRHAFLSFLATTIRQTFGAESVTVREQLGVAEAEVVHDDDDNDGGSDSGDRNNNNNEEGAAVEGGGFPGEQMYIGGGYAFRTDVDVHVLQAGGGSLAAVVALAVHAALKSMRLPAVTLHKTSAAASLEVDRGRPFRRAVDWARLPVLATALVSPTRHYVVDPAPLEELALPQQLHVAANAAGYVCYVRYQQLPSRRGNGWRLGDAEGAEAKAMFPTGMSMLDFSAVLQDLSYICQAIISECDEALRKNE